MEAVKAGREARKVMEAGRQPRALFGIRGQCDALAPHGEGETRRLTVVV
jgi:hypothetical protein